METLYVCAVIQIGGEADENRAINAWDLEGLEQIKGVKGSPKFKEQEERVEVFGDKKYLEDTKHSACKVL